MVALLAVLATIQQHVGTAVGAGAAERPTYSQAGAYVLNEGQFDTQASYIARYPGLTVLVEPTALGLVFTNLQTSQRGHFVRMAFAGLEHVALPEGKGRMQATYSYFAGSNSESWHSDVGAYESVELSEVQPGVDLLVGTHNGLPKYDLSFKRASLLDTFTVNVEGSTLVVNPDGRSLVMTAGDFSVEQPIGDAWQVNTNGQKRPVSCHFVSSTPTSFQFRCDECDPSSPLVIDPLIKWGSYLGSIDMMGGIESANAVDFDSFGNVYVVGHALGSGFPISPGAFQSQSTVSDIFVAKLRANDGALLYSCVLGGSGQNDDALAIKVDSAGRALVAGTTDSTDFPITTGAMDSVNGQPIPGRTDGFILRISPSGDQLEASSYFGGDSFDSVVALAIRPGGGVVVAGNTVTGPTMGAFPTTAGAYQTSLPSQNVELGFVAELTPDLSHLQWSTLFGVASLRIDGLAQAQNGDVVISGHAPPGGSPVTPGAYHLIAPGSVTQAIAFVARLSASGTNLLWGSAFGGPGVEDNVFVALDSADDVYVGGTTGSTQFPTTPGSFQPNAVPNALTDAFVVHLNASGSGAVYSTRIGTTGSERVGGICVDLSGIVTLSGTTSSAFPSTPGAIDALFERDFFVTRIHPSGSRLLYSTGIGNLEEEVIGRMAVSSRGTIAVCGAVYGSGFPTTPNSASPQAPGGQSDAALAVFDPFLEGVSSFGRSTPGCAGPLLANCDSVPQSTSANCVLFCSSAPPGSNGVLVLSKLQSPQGVPFQGVRLFVDLSGRVAVIPVVADSKGFAECAIPASLMKRGRHLFGQFIFDGTTACPGPISAKCASQALDLLPRR